MVSTRPEQNRKRENCGKVSTRNTKEFWRFRLTEVDYTANIGRYSGSFGPHRIYKTKPLEITYFSVPREPDGNSDFCRKNINFNKLEQNN